MTTLSPIAEPNNNNLQIPLLSQLNRNIVEKLQSTFFSGHMENFALNPLSVAFNSPFLICVFTSSGNFSNRRIENIVFHVPKKGIMMACNNQLAALSDYVYVMVAVHV